MVEAPKRATKFAANEQYTILYKSILGEDVNRQGLSILTGVSAGITEVKPTWKKEKGSGDSWGFLRQIGFGIFDSFSHINFFSHTYRSFWYIGFPCGSFRAGQDSSPG